MMKTSFGGALLIVFCVGLLKIGETEAAASRTVWMSSDTGRPFNPFTWNSWLGIPSQFMQYWFPLFQPAYQPSHLQRPINTTKPSAANHTHDDKYKDNIFGISGPPGDSVEYLPPANEIEW